MTCRVHRESLIRVATAEDDEVIGIIHDMGSERLAALLVSPVPEEAVHVAVGEQGADHPALRGAAGVLLAAAHTPLSIRARLLDRCLEPQLDQAQDMAVDDPRRD